MATLINVAEAKARLSELIARVEAGEEFTIARAGKPIARLSLEKAAPPAGRRAGMWAAVFPADWDSASALDEDDPTFWGDVHADDAAP